MRVNVTGLLPVPALSGAGFSRPLAAAEASVSADGTRPALATVRDPAQAAPFLGLRAGAAGGLLLSGGDGIAPSGAVSSLDRAGFQPATAEELGALGLKPSDLTATQGQFAADVFVKTAGAVRESIVIVRGAHTDGGPPSGESMTKAAFLSRQLSRWGQGQVTVLLQTSAAALAPAFAAPASSAQPLTGQGDHKGLARFDLPAGWIAAVQDGGARLAPALLAAAGR